MNSSPILVTGMPRSATSWVGKMLDASGEVVYINEPLNPEHPPGRTPGVRDDIERAAGVDDVIVNGSVLWKAIHHAVDRFRRDHPDLLVVRHEDLSAAPIDEFGQLFDRLGLTFGPAARGTIEQATSGGG